MGEQDLILFVIAIGMAYPARLGVRALIGLWREFEERRRFARDLDRWLAEMGLD